jgi:inner membrane protein
LDNLTHSVVGLLVAEAVIRTRERQGQRPLGDWCRSAIYLVSIVGNNLPDLDFSYSRISGKTFGYLLQHRGYTHTVPAASLFALLTLGLVFVLAKRRAELIVRADWWLLSALSLCSPLLHLIMDYANNYGVHPFWPAYDGWFYGDSFFILEPSFWLVILAPLGFSMRSRATRGALWLVLAVALGALWYRPFVPRAHAVVLSLATLGLLLLARKLAPLSRMLLALASFLCLVLAFVSGSRLAKGIVSERARVAFPGAETLDIVATPTPANPFCWSVILVERQGPEYSVRLGRVATFPAWLSVDACPYDRSANPTAPLVPIGVRADDRLRLTEEYRASLVDLQALAHERCEVRALLRFARVPYFTALAPDGTRIVGDMRYDRNPGLDFSDFRLPATQGRCPPYVPAWLPPRGDLLER